MTEVQRNEILELLRNSGFINCRYRPSDGHFFLCTAGKKGNRYREFFLKENKCRIGFWGDDYEIMRKWADAVIGPVFSVNGWVYGRKRNDRPEGEEAVWFNLVNSGMNVQGGTWFAQRQAVIDVAVRLYKKLNESGIFAKDFNAENYANGLSQGAATDETASPQFPSIASSKEQEQGSDDTTINQAASEKEEPGTNLIQPRRKGSINELGLAANMSQYWQDYYDFWDDFVRDWFEEMRRRKNSLAQCHYPYGNEKHISRDYAKMVKGLNFDELPEPYQGKPHEGVEAVFLNLNPGMSMRGLYGRYRDKDLEATKFFSNLENETGWLIREFVEAGSYSNFINNWSCLIPNLRNHEPEVCGVDWWQGIDCDRIVDVGSRTGRQIRMPWVRQVYGNPAMSSLKVFAPELCPYHSPSFHANDILGNRQLVDFMWEHVIEPALVAVKENKKVPFIIAIGEDFCKLLEKFGAKKEEEWSLERPVDKWPPHRQRWYWLYAVELGRHQQVRVLVTGGGRNKAPAADFYGVEELIRQYCFERNSN